MRYIFLIRFGIGIIFIANALAAFFAPAEFVELIKNSFVANFLPISPESFVPIVIGLNDSIVGLLLISGFAVRRTALWASVWLIGVMVVLGNSFDTLEHFGLLFISAALMFGDNQYQCPECGLHYKERNWAKKCEEWCKEHKSCNLEITSHAIESVDNK